MDHRQWRGRVFVAAAVVACLGVLLLVAGRDSRPRTAIVAGDVTGDPSTEPSLGEVAVEDAPEGSPILVKVSADAVAGTITLTFDRAVVPSSVPEAGMALIVHGKDGSCPGPSGNGHAFLEGAGTRTVVMEASYLQPGGTFITIAGGVVIGAESGLGNAPVGCTAVDTGAPSSPQVIAAVADAGPGDGGSTVTLMFDREVVPVDASRLAVYSDGACRERRGGGTGFTGQVVGSREPTMALRGGVVVTATGLEPGTVHVIVGEGVAREPYADTPNSPSGCLAVAATAPPVVQSITGDLAAGQLTIRFDRPVASGADGMLLVVHGSDPTCMSPNGNSHAYLSGMGTDTITVEATSLLAGTTYISVGSGFVTGASDGAPNRTARCVAAAIAG